MQNGLWFLSGNIYWEFCPIPYTFNIYRDTKNILFIKWTFKAVFSFCWIGWHTPSNISGLSFWSIYQSHRSAMVPTIRSSFCQLWLKYQLHFLWKRDDFATLIRTLEISSYSYCNAFIYGPAFDKCLETSIWSRNWCLGC